MHAFFELLMEGVAVWMDETRRAVDISCEEAVPGALERMMGAADVVKRLMEKAKEEWTDDEAEAAVELEAGEYKEILGVLRKGIESKVEALIDRALSRDYRGVACRMQDFGDTMRAAADVFWGIEEKGGSHE